MGVPEQVIGFTGVIVIGHWAFTPATIKNATKRVISLFILNGF
jgi:hypothetical protein